MACLITFLTLDPFIVYISIFISKWHKSSSDFQTLIVLPQSFVLNSIFNGLFWRCGGVLALKSKVWVKSDTNCQVKLLNKSGGKENDQFDKDHFWLFEKSPFLVLTIR